MMLVVFPHVVVVLIVSIIAGVAGRRSAPRRSWKRSLALGCFAATGLSVVYLVLFTITWSKEHLGHLPTFAMVLGLLLAALPSLLSARLLRRNAGR